MCFVHLLGLLLVLIFLFTIFIESSNLIDMEALQHYDKKQLGFFNIFKYFNILFFIISSFSLNAQLDFGNNSWNINCYNDLQTNANTPPTQFVGSYTQKLDASDNFGFNTTLSWGTSNLPSNATAFNDANGEGSAYTGTATDAADKKFAYIHRRKGFPIGKYKLTLLQWDDNTHVFIDGIHRPFSGENGWGSGRMIVNCFELNTNSTIEVITGNTGGGITQAIFQIVKTDVLISEEVSPQNVCHGNDLSLNGKVTLGTTDINHNLYQLNFETGTNTYTSSSASHWISTVSAGTTGSGSDFIRGTAASQGSKWIKIGPFSSTNRNSLVMSFRQFYRHGTGTSAKIEISSDDVTWENLRTWTSNSGSDIIFSPIVINIPATYENRANLYVRFLYENTEIDVTDKKWDFDDVLITGNGPANISYLWTPTTGLSDATIANPLVTITNSVTYTVGVTVGNCTVSNDVVINMIEIPIQPAGPLIVSNPGNSPNTYSVDSVSGVTYTWTTNPIVNVGAFPNGNVGSSILFAPIGTGDLIVTPTNACGTGTSFVFGNPLPVTLTDFSISCEQELTINWTTGSEQNSDYFIVEKSRDLENWINMAKQTAAGNSNSNIDYTEKDENPWNGLCYYRLKQIDFNGSEKVYNPISIICDRVNNRLNVYSDPASGVLAVNVSYNQNKIKTQIQIIELTGKIIASQDIILGDGTSEVYFSTNKLTSGIYIARIVSEKTTINPVRFYFK